MTSMIVLRVNANFYLIGGKNSFLGSSGRILKISIAAFAFVAKRLSLLKWPHKSHWSPLTIGLSKILVAGLGHAKTLLTLLMSLKNMAPKQCASILFFQKLRPQVQLQEIIQMLF